MVETELRPMPGRRTRALGLLGMWLCSAALFPLLTAWTQFFNGRRPLRLPVLGSLHFWEMLAGDLLMASLLTLSAWTGNKPVRRRPSAVTPRDRRNGALAGAALLAFLILRVLAANPGASVNWAGVLGGAAAIALLFLLAMRCAGLALPPRYLEEAGEAAARQAGPPSVPLGVHPPKNKYRSEANAREVVYHRPLSQRIGVGVGGLFFAGMFAAALWFVLLGLGLIFVPGVRMRESPALALMMGGGCVFFVCAAVSLFASVGPRELRVSPSDRTYTYRFSAPLRWPLLAGVLGTANRDEMGVPWHTVERAGTVDDMAGIQMHVTNHKSSALCSLFLRWKTPDRPSLRVGYSVDEDKARALQVQAADDLGVPMLPDEVV